MPSTNLLPELIELVVEQVADIPNENDRKQTLASAALVSKALRYQAHKFLFATILLSNRIVYRDSIVLEKRLGALLDLINADPDSEKTGIASHITTFSLDIEDSHGYPPLAATPKDILYIQYTGRILEKIFRQGTTPCSISLCFLRHHDDYLVRWSDLHPRFLTSMGEALKNPRLSTLRISLMSDIPLELLKGSFVKHVSFRRSSFADDETAITTFANEQGTSESPAPYLCPQSLEMNTLNPFNSFLDFTPSRNLPSSLVLSKLKDLKLSFLTSLQPHVQASIVAKLLTNAASTLEILTLRLETDVTVIISTFPWNGLPSLRSLHISYSREKLMPDDSLAHLVINDIKAILPEQELPTHIENLQVSLTIGHFYNGSQNLEFDFSEYPFEVLDAFFSQYRAFVRLKSLVLAFEVPLFSMPSQDAITDALERCQSALVGHFPRSWAVESFKLSIITTSWVPV